MKTAEKFATSRNLIQDGEYRVGIKALNGADKQFDRVISIGDIHGCLESLTFLLNNLSLTEKDLLICVGDYVDRGPNAPGVIEYLLDLDQKYSCVFLRGNHDSMMLNYFGFGGIHGQYWCDKCNGGSTTLRQYDVSSMETKYAAREIYPNPLRQHILAKKIPESHMEFLEKTLMYFEMDHAFYSHAGFETNFGQYDDQTEEAYTWTREGFLMRSHAKALQKHVVHGHTINRPEHVPYYIEQYKQINLDSGCFLSGTMSALIVNPAMNNMNDSIFAVSNVSKNTFELEKVDGKYRK